MWVREQRGLLVGFGIVVAVACMTVLVGGGNGLVDIVVASSEEAEVPLPGGDLPLPPSESQCNGKPATGELELEVRRDGSWKSHTLGVCHWPSYSPGGVAFSFRDRRRELSVGLRVPASGWSAGQKWRGADASVRVGMRGGEWFADDRALPCDIGDVVLRRYFAPISSYWDEPGNGRFLIGAVGEASFSCTALPSFPRKGDPIEVRGRLSVRNCEGRQEIVPPPVISARCRGYERALGLTGRTQLIVGASS